MTDVDHTGIMADPGTPPGEDAGPRLPELLDTGTDGTGDVDVAALSEECAAVVQAVPGVSAVYRADPLVTSLVLTVVDSVRREPARGRLVRVTHDETGVVIVAVVGIDGREPAAVVCRRVHTAIREHVDRRPDAFPAHIRVKIGRVG